MQIYRSENLTEMYFKRKPCYQKHVIRNMQSNTCNQNHAIRHMQSILDMQSKNMYSNQGEQASKITKFECLI